jgi:DNA-binding CsgD family transcriptional regulator
MTDMSTRANDRLWALTEKEKQTLRLIVRGHDAKSMARSLGLSVHTINERLRDARRKMAVSSSREAGRLLLEAEGGEPGVPTPDLLGDEGIGEDAARPDADQEVAPIDGVGRALRSPRILIGVFFMTLVLGLLAFAALPHAAIAPPVPAAVRTAPNPEVVDSAQKFLALVDQGRWDESYQATGAAFRKLNTPEIWAAVSQKVRVPLGAVISRTFASQENLPAPPYGYEVVKFRTHFVNKAEAVETVTLERENGGWRVMGVTIE